MNHLDDLLAQRAAIRAEIGTLKANGELVQAALTLKNKLVYIEKSIYMADPNKATDVDALIVHCDHEGNRYQGDQATFSYRGHQVCANCLGFQEGDEVCIVCDAPAGKCTHEKADLENPSRDEGDHVWCLCGYID